ncbi:hypothetical protein FGO68_gene12504 [Halteria grandinella]|uniref:Uncharacterized protein n=1 Tax=Halteria grandinella TaxID=5974 RepID=A0A8J8P719_HALGN|nr:hypothetical protein FGO68_gene12504 [Halteria grandinella]
MQVLLISSLAQPLTLDDCQIETLDSALQPEPYCLLCRQGYIVYENKCIKKCPSGTHYSYEPMSYELKAKLISKGDYSE